MESGEGNMHLANSMNENMRHKTEKSASCPSHFVISIAQLQLPPMDGGATIKYYSYLALLFFHFESESTAAIHATHATRQLRVIPFRATRDAKMPPDRPPSCPLAVSSAGAEPLELLPSTCACL